MQGAEASLEQGKKAAISGRESIPELKYLQLSNCVFSLYPSLLIK